MTKWIPVSPTPKQSAFLWLTCRDAFYGGAGGGGKSVALLMAALQYSDIPGYNALLIRDTLKNLEQPKALKDLAFSWFANTEAEWSEKKNAWYFPCDNGGYSTLRFGYLDSPRAHFNYQGGENHFIGIDECVNIRKNQIDFLFGWLRKEKNFPVPLRFRCASNPPMAEQVERGAWVKRKYVDPKTREKGVVFIPAMITDNPYLDELDYRESLSHMDPVSRAKIERGDWDIQLEGIFLDSYWFKLVDVAPVNAKRVRYGDMAATEKNDTNNPCFTAGALISMDTMGSYYIEDIKRTRKEPKEIEASLMLTAKLDGVGVKIFMEQEPGSSGKIVIDNYRRKTLNGFAFQGDRVSGSKVTRATPFATQAEAGNVYVVKGKWNKAFFDECDLFPNSEFKDQVDAVSGGITKLASSGFFRSRVL